jgi:hypothetical protein
MEIGSIIDLLQGPPETAALKAGDLLNVKVLEVFDDRRALVDLGRFRTLAVVTFPVAAGEVIRVRVQETRGQLRLQLVPAPGGPAPSARTAAGPVQAAAVESLQQLQARIDQLAGALQRLPGLPPLPPEFRQVVDALRLFLEPFEPGSGPEAIARKLQEFCEDSGLFLEQRLADALKRAADRAGGAPNPEAGSAGSPGRILAADLKARLLFLKGFFDSPAGRQLAHDHREVGGLAKAAAELLADLRAGQEQMAKPAAASDPFRMVHFALPLPDDRGRAGLKIAYRRRPAAGAQEGHRAAILLQLDRMGAVRADLTLLNAGLNVSIFVSDSGLRDHVNRHAPEVRDALAPYFDHVAVQVSVSPRKIERFASEDWRPAGETQVDVRA